MLAVDLEERNVAFAKVSPQTILTWALVEAFPGKIAIACGFGAEGMVILDMALRIDPRVRIFTLDTGKLFPETYQLMSDVDRHYGITVERILPDPIALKNMIDAHGETLYKESVDLRKECCRVRKVAQLPKALVGCDAWIASLRNGQSEERKKARVVAMDDDHGIVKINPLAHWSWGDVWNYIRKNNVPYNPLYDRGFPSIGCSCCTRAILPDENPRAGRWCWEDSETKECGIHESRVLIQICK